MSALDVQPAEPGFFVTLVIAGSLSVATCSLGIAASAVSKCLTQMEVRIGVPLATRTTRRMSLIPEGEAFLEHTCCILGEIDNLDQLFTWAKDRSSGLFRVNATPSFGRMYIAPVISEYIEVYPDVNMQLQFSASPSPLNEDLSDVCVRPDEPLGIRIVVREVASSRCLFCASSVHLRKRGTPATPVELVRHNCISICQGSDAYGMRGLVPDKGAKYRTETVYVRGNLTTNDGEIAVNRALEEHGIVMCAQQDIERYFKNGRLAQVLP